MNGWKMNWKGERKVNVKFEKTYNLFMSYYSLSVTGDGKFLDRIQLTRFSYKELNQFLSYLDKKIESSEQQLRDKIEILQYETLFLIEREERKKIKY